MTASDRPLSRKKLLDFLKAAYTDPTNADCMNRYISVVSRNHLASTVIIGIVSGDFDEPVPVLPSDEEAKRIALEIMPGAREPRSELLEFVLRKSSETAPTGSADAEPRSPTMPRGDGR